MVAFRLNVEAKSEAPSEIPFPFSITLSYTVGDPGDIRDWHDRVGPKYPAAESGNRAGFTGKAPPATGGGSNFQVSH